MLFRQWSVSAYPHTSTVESWSCTGLRCEIQIVNNSCFPKIVLIMKFCPARGQKMSIHKCYLAGFNETSTVRHAQTLRLQRRLRFLAKILKKKKNLLQLQLGSCFAPAVCWTVFHVSEWNSPTVHLKTASSHLFLESWGSLWPWLFCYAAPSSAGSSWWGSLNFHLKRSVCLRRGWWTKKLGQLTCLLACLHFCRCDSAGYSADLLC